MAELKTKLTTQSALAWLKTIEPEAKREDGLRLLKMFERVTGKPAKMWGTSIVGFDMYHYKSERSAQEGDWPFIGFSPRKQALTLYIIHGDKHIEDLLKKLGKHKQSKGCLYINKLSDVDLKVLEELVKTCYLYNKKTFASK